MILVKPSNFFLLFVAIIIFGCQNSSKPSPPSKISSDHVKNHEKPTKVPVSYKLLEIKKLTDEDNILDPVSLAEHPKGMLIADFSHTNIQCFNVNGEKVFEFGTKGQGPGEFTNLLSICTTQDAIFTYDISRSVFSQFSLDGLFIKEQHVVRKPTKVLVHGQHAVFAYFHNQSLPDIEIRNLNGDLVKDIFLKNADSVTYYCTLFLDSVGNIYTSALNKYDIEVYTPSGEYMKTISRNFENMPFIEHPATGDFFSIIPVAGIAVTSNNIFVLSGGHQLQYQDVTGRKLEDRFNNRIDIFDSQGQRVAFVWSDVLSKQTKDLHSVPAFVVDHNNNFWISDNNGEIHILKLMTE